MPGLRPAVACGLGVRIRPSLRRSSACARRLFSARTRCLASVISARISFSRSRRVGALARMVKNTAGTRPICCQSFTMLGAALTACAICLRPPYPLAGQAAVKISTSRQLTHASAASQDPSRSAIARRGRRCWPCCSRAIPSSHRSSIACSAPPSTQSGPRSCNSGAYDTFATGLAWRFAAAA